MAVIVQSTTNKSEAAPVPSNRQNAKPPDIASASVTDTLATLDVNPDTGLTHAEVDAQREENGYNEVAEVKGHPVLKFVREFYEGCVSHDRKKDAVYVSDKSLSLPAVLVIIAP